jgi:hypothetical protein
MMTTEQTSQQVRQRGVVMLVLGVLLSGGMSCLLLWMFSVMHPAISRTSSSFTGTRTDATFIFGILGTVLVVGIMGCITGIWQIVTGRVSQMLRIASLAGGLLAFALALIFYLKS